MSKLIKRAIISVSDKTNLSSVLKILNKNKIDIISSGGTYNYIKKMVINAQKFLITLILKKCLMEE